MGLSLDNKCLAGVFLETEGDFVMKNIVRFAISVFVSFAFIVLPISSQADSVAFNAFYVFGDSLSDTGNVFNLTNKVVPPSPYYREGRFSNGSVAFEYLWMALTGSKQAKLKPSLGIVNWSTDKAVSFAYGGATTEIINLTPDADPGPGITSFPVDGLVRQVNNFIQIIQSKKIKLDKKNTLYALWAGANDYLLPPGSVTFPNSDCSYDPLNPVPHVVCNISDAIEKLYLSVGAKNFLVPNLSDLGSVPIVNNPAFYNPIYLGLTPSAFFKQLTIAHNSALKAALGQLKKDYPDIHIIYVDVYPLMDTLLKIFPHGAEAGPAGYCLFDVTTCNQPPNSFIAPGYVFWDGEHPTTSVDALLAVTMLAAMHSM
jgi:phospholipase/lecithinase/hemolysin